MSSSYRPNPCRTSSEADRSDNREVIHGRASRADRDALERARCRKPPDRGVMHVETARDVHLRLAGTQPLDGTAARNVLNIRCLQSVAMHGEPALFGAGEWRCVTAARALTAARRARPMRMRNDR
jgi:hypothetical protein